MNATIFLGTQHDAAKSFKQHQFIQHLLQYGSVSDTSAIKMQ
jgi:hypothetical protein